MRPRVSPRGAQRPRGEKREARGERGGCGRLLTLSSQASTHTGGGNRRDGHGVRRPSVERLKKG